MIVYKITKVDDGQSFYSKSADIEYLFDGADAGEEISEFLVFGGVLCCRFVRLAGSTRDLIVLSLYKPQSYAKIPPNKNSKAKEANIKSRLCFGG
jgi:hypothetical protein